MAEKNDALLIHVGLHKTGSTSIQRALTAAGLRSSLRRFEDLNSTSIQQAWRRGEVISGEGLLGTMRTLYGDAEERIKALCNLGLPLHIVLFVRPIIEWHQAMYIQRIQEGDSLSPSEYVDSVRRCTHFQVSPLVDALLAIQPTHKISLLEFSGNVVQDFAREAGLRLSEPRQRFNRSMDPARAVLAHRINGLAGFEATRTLRTVMQNEVPILHSRDKLTVFSADDVSAFEPALQDWADNVAPRLAFPAAGGGGI